MARAPPFRGPRVNRVALAIFVKTPGRSPIKTRLAAGVGDEVAAQFYEHALRIVAAVARTVAANGPGLIPHWAVAESDALADPHWAGLPRVAQGPGGLGERMARVYRDLRQSHDGVLLLGADAPLLDPASLIEASRTLASGEAPFVMGRSRDGGFHLFGGSLDIPDSHWSAVRYSAPDTAEHWLEIIRPLGAVRLLGETIDVDVRRDLEALSGAAGPLDRLLPEQRALLTWVAGLDRAGWPPSKGGAPAQAP